MDRRSFLKSIAAGGCVSPLMGIQGDKKVDEVTYSSIVIGKTDNTNFTNYPGDKKWEPSLTNCYIISKGLDQDGPMFWQQNGHIDCNLDGYAILPIKKLENLVGKKVEDIKYSDFA